VEVGTAVPVQVLNVHLRSLFSAESGVLQSYLSTSADHVREIRDFTSRGNDDMSNIVLGDFNEDPDGDAIRYLEGLGFENALPAFHPGQPTWRFRSVGGQLEKTFDHILYDESLRPLNAWVEPLGRSDHLPVLAHFEPHVW
jgi:endonuclease/exonuclease/phosphatase (EEP) superfamily protein YafD